MTRQKKAYLFALSAVLCWSTVASAFKIALREIDPASLLFYSTLIATMLLFAMEYGRKSRTPIHPVRDFRSTILPSAINGFLNPFLYYIVLFEAYKLLPAQEAQPLNFTWPIMIVLLSAPMLGQRIRPVDLVGLTVSFLGVLVISTRGDLLHLSFTNLPGALLALGSSLVWAVYWLRLVKDQREVIPKLFLNFLFGLIYISLFLALQGRPPAITGVGMAGSAWIGVFEMGLTFFLWLKAMSLSETSARVSNLVYLTPFLSLIPIRFIVGEAILPSSVAGLALIVGGILLGKLKK